jgi:hypothetical protein
MADTQWPEFAWYSLLTGLAVKFAICRLLEGCLKESENTSDSILEIVRTQRWYASWTQGWLALSGREDMVEETKINQLASGHVCQNISWWDHLMTRPSSFCLVPARHLSHWVHQLLQCESATWWLQWLHHKQANGNRSKERELGNVSGSGRVNSKNSVPLWNGHGTCYKNILNGLYIVSWAQESNALLFEAIGQELKVLVGKEIQDQKSAQNGKKKCSRLMFRK